MPAQLLVLLLLALQEAEPQANRTFQITARRFTFDVTPSPFVVNEGDMVTVVLTAADDGDGTGHGLFIEQYAQSANFIRQGESLTLQFVASVPGSFTFFCTRVCGAGHGDMKGVFTVVGAQAQPPAISSFTPPSGPAAGGTVVTINGARFQTGAAVQFDTAPATSVFVASATQIFATAPAHAPGEVTIRVTNPDGRSVTSTQRYRYEASMAITSIAPDSGTTAGGTEVTIRGSGFAAGATARIGDRALQNVTVVNDGLIRATTPLGPPNVAARLTRDVTVNNADGTTARLANGFAWVLPPPSIASIVPAAGSRNGGTAVTITGAGFSTAVGLTVTFGGAAATDVQVVDAVTLTAVTPARAAGKADVTVTGTHGSATAAGAFTFTGASGRRRSVRH